MASGGQCADLAQQGRNIPIHPLAYDLPSSVLRDGAPPYALSAPTRSRNAHQLTLVSSRGMPLRNDAVPARHHLLDVKAKIGERFEVHLHRLSCGFSPA